MANVSKNNFLVPSSLHRNSASCNNGIYAYRSMNNSSSWILKNDQLSSLDRKSALKSTDVNNNNFFSSQYHPVHYLKKLEIPQSFSMTYNLIDINVGKSNSTKNCANNHSNGKLVANAESSDNNVINNKVNQLVKNGNGFSTRLTLNNSNGFNKYNKVNGAFKTTVAINGYGSIRNNSNLKDCRNEITCDELFRLRNKFTNVSKIFLLYFLA